jgi:hypothetical protein
MNSFTYVIISVVATNIALAEEIDLPFPAPSFMTQQIHKGKKFNKLIDLDLADAKFCYLRGERVTIIYNKNGIFVAYFEISGVDEDGSKNDISTSVISPDLAVAIIGLWATWLSRSHYQEETSDPLPFYYAAASRNDNQFYEGLLPPLIPKNLFAVKMNQLARKIDIHIKMSSVAAGSHNQLKELPGISHNELKRMIDESRTELLDEIKALHEHLKK